MLVKKIKKYITIELIIVAIAQGLYLLQGVIQNKIFSSFFDVSVYGEWALLTSLYTLISMIPFSAVDQGVYRLTPTCKDEKERKKLYGTVAILYFSCFLVYSLLFFGGTIVFSEENFFLNEYVAFFLLYSFTEIIKNTFVAIYNVDRKRKKVLLVRTIGIVSRTALLVLLYMFGNFTIKNVLLILVVTNILIILVCMDVVKKNIIKN